ncbi:MerR family transcriptional regulator [Tepidibacter aestuarii]|uniref:MerR family transcriptional regulator n=1 Tax=Tepidibacter aestuarii TaxID=2925782 RepID=UPI0020BE910C|nr:methyltransferase domain-containing protein [Tepidibacter aestuarii]CAH2214915.1 putative AdoMet-dependent methyltransferase [Tepidibacter aestuarii]
MCKKYTIKEISNTLNISSNKIRFYEEKGLIHPIRTNNNYRIYSEEDLAKLQLILTYRTLNISIEDIKNLMKKCSKDNMINHFYKQWKIINDEMQKIRTIKTSLEDIMDSIYESDKNNYTDYIIESVKKLNHINNLKNNWSDRWNFDDWSKSYDEFVKKDNTILQIYKNYDKVLHEVFVKSTKNLKISSKFLEIGVGTGNLSKVFLDENYDITGIDQSREMLNTAKQKFPELKLRLGEFLKIPFENNIFDSIVSTYAFHHLNDEEKIIAIQEMLRVLKSDGKIIIGDLMFENELSKNEIFKTLSRDQVNEIEDEYYSNIEFLKIEFEKYNKYINYTKIDKLNYIVEVCSN